MNIMDWITKKTYCAQHLTDVTEAQKKLFDLHGSKELASTSCGCTLKVGETVIVEGAGKGKILSRDNRVLTITLPDGVKRQFDQNFVHHLRK